MAADKSPEIVRMKEAQKAYKKAKSAYKESTSSAKSSLKKAERAHSEGVKSAEKALSESKDDILKPIGSFAGAKLYWDHIVNKKSSLALEEGMAIEVNASGNTYTAVANTGNVETSSSSPVASSTSSVYGGSDAISALGADNATSADSRNLFITLKTSSNAMTIQCKPGKEKEARDFADAIAAAASKVSAQAEANRLRLNDAHGQIARSRGDTDHLDEAKDAAAVAEADTTEVNEAKGALDRAIAAVPKDELAAYRSARRRRKAILIAVIVVLILVLVAVVYFMLR